MFKLLRWFSLALALALAAPTVYAGTTTQDWSGATVSITYPDTVTYNTAFDLSFSVDAATMSQYGAIAFLSELRISDSVNLSGATWGYQYFSDDAGWNLSRSGVLGDSYAEFLSTASGYRVAFSDPITSPFTWLWRDFNDAVTWTVHNMVIQGDTTFSLRLDDDGILDGPLERGFTVLAQSGATQIPEPAIVVPMLLGLLGWSASARARSRQRRMS